MALLFLFSGLSYVWTAFLPQGAVVQAFVVAVTRGITSSWPEFLMDLALIASARNDSDRTSGLPTQSQQQTQQSSPSQQLQPPSSSQYEPTASLFQSQAATCRNIGSLVASFLTVCLFGVRLRINVETQLSVALVTALLLAAAGLQFAASGIALFHSGSILRLFRRRRQQQQQQQQQRNRAHHTVRHPIPPNDNGGGSSSVAGGGGGNEAVRMHNAVLARNNNRQQHTRVHFNARQPYESIATHDEQDIVAENNDGPLGGSTMIPPLSLEEQQQQQGPSQQIQSTTLASSSSQASSLSLYKQWMQFQQRCDVVTLASFQLLLILAALQHPIESVISTQVWILLLLTTAFCLLGAILFSLFFQRKLRSCRYPPRQETPGIVQMRNSTKPVPPRRLGMYLILHHSVPISAFLMYSYLYTVFVAEPLFLQILSMAGTAASTGATWVYGRYLATQYSTGWSMIRLIAVLSIVVAVISLLDVLVVHTVVAQQQVDWADDDDDDDDASSTKFTTRIRLYCLVFLVRVVTSFSGEIGFMPSVVLATTNVVKSDRNNELDSSNDRDLVEEEGSEGDNNDDTEGNSIPMNDYMEALASTPTLEETRILHQDEQDEHVVTAAPVYDESMQYASFVSCIDFGAQVGDWLSVPIIAALGVSRDNGWENLDWFIAICAIGRIASIAFLPLIIVRPAS